MRVFHPSYGQAILRYAPNRLEAKAKMVRDEQSALETLEETDAFVNARVPRILKYYEGEYIGHLKTEQTGHPFYGTKFGRRAHPHIPEIAELVLRTHLQGVSNMDIKPDNVLYNGSVRLYDFDIAVSRLSDPLAAFKVGVSNDKKFFKIKTGYALTDFKVA
jgi:hypothetical protein